MERKFTIVYGGYAIHAGGKPLPDGTYAPTLAIAFGEGRARTELDLPVPGAGAYVTIREAQEHAFEEGVRWVKERC
jgi:hypothetical protein